MQRLLILTTGVVVILIILMAGSNMPALEVRRNSLGKAMPADAAPLNQQVLSYFIDEPRSLDISIDNYGAAGTDIWLFERLVMMNADDEPRPGAAERWEVSDDGSVWTFHLRPGARWSDGVPVTAHDFEFTYRRFFDPNIGNVFASLLYPIKNARAYNHGEITDPGQLGVRALDDLTLQIETEGPCPYLPVALAVNSAAPVPQRVVQKYGKRWTEPDKVVTNYSYRLHEWTPGRRLVYSLNPHYNGRYPGFLERINHKISTGAVGILPYENNEADRHPVGVKDLMVLRGNPELAAEVHKNPNFLTWYLFFQTKKPPFHDLRIRQAISHAIDREALCRGVLRGYAQPAYTMLPPHFPGYVGDKHKDIQRYDPALGRRLLAEAGYPGGRGFPRIECWIRNISPTSHIMDVSQAIQQMLKDNLGIDIVLVNQEVGVFMDNMYQQTIPLGLISYQYDYLDPHNLLTQIWHANPPGRGRHDWLNTRFDELVDLAAVTMDVEHRLRLYDEAEQILATDVGGVFLFHPDLLELRKPWFRGLTPNRFGRTLFSTLHTNLMDIYIGDNVEERVY